MRYFLALGSNVGNRRRNLARAIRLLEKAGVRVLRTSSIYETEPVGVTEQPWFLNEVVEAETDRAPHELLVLVKSLEVRLKRRPAPTKGPRRIDIDILLAGETVLETAELVIPHPRLAHRNFVLAPLSEIAPAAVHPVLGETIAELARRSGDQSRVIELPKERTAKGRGSL
jgi:2-amino-4-hydroxy-6-hydroxymethyldihydropteridine diphosphokinase